MSVYSPSLNDTKGLLFRLFRSALAILVVGKATQLFLHAVMARELGPAGFGLISLAIATSNVLSPLMTFGLPMASMRFVSAYRGNEDWPLLAGYLKWTASVVLVAIMVGETIAVGLWAFVSNEGEKGLAAVVAFVLPVFLLAAVREGVMRGFQSITAALGPREIVAPLLAVGGLTFFSPEQPLRAAMIYAAAYMAAELAGGYLLGRELPPELRAVPVETRIRRWLSVAIPMQLAGTSRILLQRIDLLYVGFFLGLEWAGIYALAHRLAQVLNLIGRLSSFAISPAMAKAYHVEDPRKLLDICRGATLIMMAVGIPTYIAVAIFAPSLVEIFGGGHQYSDAVNILIILSAGQLSNAVFNPASQALLMSRYERLQLSLVMAATGLAVVFHPLAIKGFGAIGASVVTAVMLIIMNGSSYWYGFRQLRSSISD